jgi:hypothetical protein
MIGLVTYVTADKAILCTVVAGNGHAIGVKYGHITIFNVYKPPSEGWNSPPLPSAEHPCMYVGDFNSHSPLWGYSVSNTDGAELERWMEGAGCFLVHDAKQSPTFRSAHWGTTSSPNLCFVMCSQQGRPLMTERTIVSRFPRSQHKVAIMEVSRLPSFQNRAMPRWNLRKANWTAFTEEIERTVKRIPVSIENYRFTGLIWAAAKRSMPREHRRNYIPCWSKECSNLLGEYQISHSDENADRLIQKLDEERRGRWMDAMERMDITHSSRQSWNLLQKLRAAKSITTQVNITPDAIADTICEVGNIDVSRRDSLRMRRSLRRELSRCPERSAFVDPVECDEVVAAIKKMKQGKAAGVDGILPEFLKNLGPKAISWLTSLFTAVMEQARTPMVWKRAKIVAILKPGKEPGDPRAIDQLRSYQWSISFSSASCWPGLEGDWRSASHLSKLGSGRDVIVRSRCFLSQLT